MRDGRVFVRTIAGLKRADVLWRHVDAEWCDPLELNSASHIGVPGLIDAIRAGGVAVENMPGSGLVESRALLAFLPKLARRLLGEDLVMPNIATWWCGQPAERARVLASLETVSIAGAFRRRRAGLRRRAQAWSAANSTGEERARAARRDRDARRRLCRAGHRAALDDAAAGSTAGSSPRPFVLRVYAAATPDGWRVMPGGFARVSDKPDARAVSMGAGVESADVWVLADKPVEATSLLPTPEKVRIVRMLGNLPSRAADNLFWFGRYLEREEATLRLVRCLCARAVDPDAPMDGARAVDRAAEAAARRLGRDRCRRRRRRRRPRRARRRCATPSNTARRSSIARSARYAASVIRERLTPQTWQLIGRLETLILETPQRALDRSRNPRLRRRGADHDRRARGPVRREFQSRRRLDLLRARPAHRARHQHLPARAPVRASGRDRAQSRRAARSHRLADHLSLAHADRRRAGAGARHGAARPLQSALGRLSDAS